ncbi:hypothetical protein MKW92_019703 [Papaver armeniacum]|nr:hypothetical protein MKW92_019703 [Papaver armeniacum]
MADSQESLNPKTLRRRTHSTTSSNKIDTVGVNEIEKDPTMNLDSSDEDRTNLVTNQESLLNTEDSSSLISNGEEENESSSGGGGGVSGGGDGGGDGGGERSTNFAEKYMYRASAPAHRRVKESPLSSDAIFRQSHAGLFNLCIVVLVAVNSRLIIENLMKYGLLIGSGFWFSSTSLRDWPLFMCCLSLPLFAVAAYMVEKLAQNKLVPEPVVISLHVLITTASMLYPVCMILNYVWRNTNAFASVVWLKLVSYAHTNYDMRVLSKSSDKGDVSSNSSDTDNSNNVNIKSLAYFMVAPTLCYQTSYPRTTCIRKGWVTRQCNFVVYQSNCPELSTSTEGDLLYAIERVLKLSVPTLYVWLCMFYCFFHLWFNILAEVLRFGDREFYKDWWNAKTIEEPVHKWMVRHVYFPCLRNGIPKGVAVVISFFVSAIFHELCIAVPCHIFKFWAFIGIMVQVPLVLLTNYLQNKFQNTMVGNMVFWFFFSILGQPMCLLLYYHDVMNQRVRTP